MQEVLREVAERIVRREEERKRLGESLRSSLEPYIRKVDPSPPTATVGAVDGGIVHEEYGPIVLLLVRSVGALFSYEEGELKDVTYVPSPLPPPEVIVNDGPLEREDYHPFISLHRLSSELRRALEVAEASPDFLFLDGSVVPQIVDKPRNDRLRPYYRSLIPLFLKLYSFYPSILVAGIVKDSRGNRFGLYLREEGISVPNWQDVSWLNYVLREGEYTKPIPYSEEPKKHATLQDLDDEAEYIYITFVRPSALDRPYRVEFYSKHPERDAERIASLLVPLGSLHRHYAIPPFLVEVDMRARLSKQTLSYVKSYVERIVMGRFPHLRLFERRPY